MKLTELQEKIKSFAKKHGFKHQRLFIFWNGENNYSEYDIELKFRKKHPERLTIKGKNPEWCLNHLQQLLDLYASEPQENTDIELE